jgi:hypothetical protein
MEVHVCHKQVYSFAPQWVKRSGDHGGQFCGPTRPIQLQENTDKIMCRLKFMTGILNICCCNNDPGYIK